MANPQNSYPRSKQRWIQEFCPCRCGFASLFHPATPDGPLVPAIHPTSKLVGILAYEIKTPQGHPAAFESQKYVFRQL